MLNYQRVSHRRTSYNSNCTPYWHHLTKSGCHSCHVAMAWHTWPHPTVPVRPRVVSWGSASITFSSPVIFWTVTEIFAMALGSCRAVEWGWWLAREVRWGAYVLPEYVIVVSGAFDFLIFLDIVDYSHYTTSVFRSDEWCNTLTTKIHPKSIPLIYTSMILHVIRKDLTEGRGMTVQESGTPFRIPYAVSVSFRIHSV